MESSSRVLLPNNIQGIPLYFDSEDFSEEFSTQPKLYGGVQLDEDDKVALELPVMYDLYKKLMLVKCRIDIEEPLNKLRWNKTF